MARESYRDFGCQPAWYSLAQLGPAWPSLACILAMLDRLGSLGAKLPCKEFGLEVLCILRDQVKQ